VAGLGGYMRGRRDWDEAAGRAGDVLDEAERRIWIWICTWLH
jgi:hypothetical protein